MIRGSREVDACFLRKTKTDNGCELRVAGCVFRGAVAGGCAFSEGVKTQPQPEVAFPRACPRAYAYLVYIN